MRPPREARSDGREAPRTPDVAETKPAAADAPERDPRQMEAMIEELAAANSAKNVFLANISHEIRTPLNAMLGLAQVLEHSAKEPGHVEIAQRIRAAGTLLLRTINDVLDLTQLEAGQLALEREPMQVGHVLEHIADLMGGMARTKGIELTVDVATSAELQLFGDARRLEQILLNLVSNAIKFTSQGRIDISVRRADRGRRSVRLRFEVRDSGIGIAPEQLASVFEPFTQADGGLNRRFGGSGVGLAIGKRLVELMGGTIGVESKENEGSTFWFEIPFEPARGAATGVVPRAPVRLRPAQGPRLPGMRLLVVDDSAMNLDLVERVLKREGAAVTVAHDGAQALELLRREPVGFDVVLMDLQMPVLDGLQATRLIRDELGLKALPVIAWSAGIYNDDRKRALDAGANDFIVKPIDVGQLVSALLQWTPQPATAVPPAATPATTPAPQAENPKRFPEIAGIDRERAEMLLNGEREFFLELLRDFASEYGATIALVETALARGDPTAAAACLHKVRGTAGYLGVTALVQVARELEDAILTGADTVPTLLPAYANAMTALLAAAAPWIGGATLPARDAGSASESAAAAVNRGDLDPLLAELAPLLDRNMLKARGVIDSIEALVAGTALATPFRAVSEPTRELRFKDAAAALKGFVAAHLAAGQPRKRLPGTR